MITQETVNNAFIDGIVLGYFLGIISSIVVVAIQIIKSKNREP
jgi:hypothetical protein